MPKKNNQEKEQFTIYFTPAVHRKIRDQAKDKRITLSQFVENACLMKMYEDEKSKKTVKEFLEEFWTFPEGIDSKDIDVCFIFNPKLRKPLDETIEKSCKKLIKEINQKHRNRPIKKKNNKTKVKKLKTKIETP